MADTVYLNGVFMEREEAAISIDDRGFRLGDGVFETIPVYSGVPYLWDAHEARLNEGLCATRIPTPEAEFPLQEIAADIIHMNRIKDGFVRISVSRGVGSRGYWPDPADGTIPPTLLIETRKRTQYEWDPMTVWIASYRKLAKEALPTNSKLAQGMNATLALLEAQDHQCQEALQINANGQVCEAASGNIFWLSKGTLYTPSLDTGCLAGVTRQAIMRLSPYPVREVNADLDQLGSAEAVVLSNCNWRVAPVRFIRPKGWRYDSVALAKTLRTLLEDDITSYCRKHAA